MSKFYYWVERAFWITIGALISQFIWVLLR